MYPFLFENEYFSSVWPTWHGMTYPVKTVTEKGHFFSPEWRFLKTPASHLRVDGLKTEVFGFNDVIHQYTSTMMHAT